LLILILCRSRRLSVLISVILLNIYTIGTVSFVQEYGRIHDSWQNVAFSKIVIDGGAISFGQNYVSANPSFFIESGVLLKTCAFQVLEMIQIFPVVAGLIYIFGIIILCQSICKMKQYTGNPLSIASMAILFMLTFSLSLFGLRINASPQTFALILVPFFLAFNLREGIAWTVLSSLLFLSITMTHMLTSIVALVWCSLLLVLNKRLQKRVLVLYCILFFAWTLYVGYWGFNQGISVASSFSEYFTSSLFDTDLSAAQSQISPLGDAYLQIRRTALVAAGSLLVLSTLVLAQKQRCILISLLSLPFALIPLFCIYLVGGPFSERFFPFVSIPLCLIFGFGIYELSVANFDQGSYKAFGWLPSFMEIRKYAIPLAFGLIVCGGILSVYICGNGDAIWSNSAEETSGVKFAIEKTSHETKIIYAFAIPYDNYEDILSRYIVINPIDYKRTEYISDPLFMRDHTLIIISNQWFNWQRIIETSDVTSLHTVEQHMNNNKGAIIFYRNGGVYLVLN